MHNTPKNIKVYEEIITRRDREIHNRHKSAAFWFTGLSGAGKSTIAHEVDKKLFHAGLRSVVFDGDNVRHGLCGDLYFSAQDRTENIRRIAEVTKLFIENGTICICALISPSNIDRDNAAKIIGENNFHLIHIDCPLEVCEQRDCKGYYKLARTGKIKDYTGISSPFDPPTSAELTLNTNLLSIEKATNILFAKMIEIVS